MLRLQCWIQIMVKRKRQKKCHILSGEDRSLEFKIDMEVELVILRQIGKKMDQATTSEFQMLDSTS